METLYRKVAVSERKPKEGWVLTPSGGWLFVDNKFKCPNSGYYQDIGAITHWLEEVPDNEAELRKENKEMKAMIKNLIDTLGSLEAYELPIYNEADKLLKKLK